MCDLAHRRAELLEARAALDQQLTEIEAAMGTADSLRRDDPFTASTSLKRAAGVWGLSYEGARLKAIRLAPTGLARKIRPGGWRISAAALETNHPNPIGGRRG